MDNKDIEVSVHASDSEESTRSRDNSIDGSSVPTRVSDVGRGGNPHTGNASRNNSHQQSILSPKSTRTNSILTKSPKEQYYPPRHFQQSLAEVIVPPNMDGSGKYYRLH